jgi:hypothetical protein
MAYALMDVTAIMGVERTLYEIKVKWKQIQTVVQMSDKSIKKYVLA